VESDLNILSGAESLVILSGNSGYYDLSVRPLRRGVYRGVIAFVGQQPDMCVSYCRFVLSYLEIWTHMQLSPNQSVCL